MLWHFEPDLLNCIFSFAISLTGGLIALYALFHVVPHFLDIIQARSGMAKQNHDSKVHGAKMGPIWDRQDPGGPHVGPMNFAIWEGCYQYCGFTH